MVLAKCILQVLVKTGGKKCSMAWRNLTLGFPERPVVSVQMQFGILKVYACNNLALAVKAHKSAPPWIPRSEA